MNSAKSTPPQRDVIVCWFQEKRKRPELNKLVLYYYYYYYYYYYHHHHHHPNIITQDCQCVGSKLLSIFVVDNKYGDGKNELPSKSPEHLSIPSNITQGKKEIACVAPWGGQKSILSVKYHYFDGPLNPQLMGE
jgi:hypothetical protein